MFNNFSETKSIRNLHEMAEYFMSEVPKYIAASEEDKVNSMTIKYLLGI